MTHTKCGVSKLKSIEENAANEMEFPHHQKFSIHRTSSDKLYKRTNIIDTARTDYADKLFK
jgi:hypothetical protein